MMNEKCIKKSKINLETAQVAWADLQRFFAQGVVIYVDEGLSLVEVAYRLSDDDASATQDWLEKKKIGKVSNMQAQTWIDEEKWLWSVVIRPWVLVQEIGGSC